MRYRLRAAALLLLSAGAACSAAAAVESVKPAWEWALPREIYESFTGQTEEPAYLLRSRDGLVAVYEGENRRVPAVITDIELATLRRADRAMLDRGIPAADREQMLMLLEDLGS